MTTPPAASQHALRSITREQLVAALLVGSVAILLGFASGLGVSTASTQAGATPTISTTGVPSGPDTSPAATSATGAPPVAYVLQPALPASAVATITTAASPEPSPVSATSASASASATTPPPTRTCTSGLLTSILETLLPAEGPPIANPFGLSELLRALRLVTSGLVQLLTLPQPQLLETVTRLLATPDPALARSCTTGVQTALPLIAGGVTIPSAARAVTASRK